MTELPEPEPSRLSELVLAALAEDLGDVGDVTSQIVPADFEARALIIVKSPGVLAGIPWAEAAFWRVDSAIRIGWASTDGDEIAPGMAIATISGRARSILAGERVALNFLQHLSGVATATAELADICSRYGVRLLCTRKTLPGLRDAQRYAVVAGGGYLHRAGLHESILIKTNHVKLVGEISKAVAKAGAIPSNTIEVEVTTLEELRDAIAAGAQSVLLDNPDLSTIEQAVELASGKVTLEVSGGVNLENIEEIAKRRPDAISAGSITHSVKAVDMALYFEGS